MFLPLAALNIVTQGVQKSAIFNWINNRYMLVRFRQKHVFAIKKKYFALTIM
jgi:hypothetical protein